MIKLTENFAITQDNYDTRIWAIQDSLDDLRERMRTEIRKKNKKDNDIDNGNEL